MAKKKKVQAPKKQWVKAAVGSDIDDAILEAVVKKVSKKVKSSGGIVTLGGDAGAVPLWIPSRIPNLNAILDRSSRGFPTGRVIEIFGDEQTAKSGLGLDLIAQAQRMGGVGILHNTEESFDKRLAMRCYGVNLKQLVITELDTVEEIFDSTATILADLRKKYPDAPIVIDWDSVAETSTAEEMKKAVGKGMGGAKRASFISQGIRKTKRLLSRSPTLLCLINQTRENINVMFGDVLTSGGKSIKFATSQRIHIRRVAKIWRTVSGVKQVVGIKLRMDIVKNRYHTPFQSVMVNLYFEKGFRAIK